MPRILDPAEVDALFAARRTWRDRAMVEAMLFGGLRRCEVLGLGLDDINPGERRVFSREGKGGHQRITPISNRFFETLTVTWLGIGEVLLKTVLSTTRSSR